MGIRGCLAIGCAIFLLFCNASAAGISLDDLIESESENTGISIPQLPPPEGDSLLARKVLDSQPQIYKSSTRLLREAEISRDSANRKWEAEMVKYRQKIKQESGKDYTLEFLKDGWLRSPDPAYTPEMIEALEEYEYANKKYNAALAMTGEKDYEEKARIFESAADMYASIGNTKAQKQTENAALAARAQAAAESIFLPLPFWTAVLAVIGGFILARGKRV